MSVTHTGLEYRKVSFDAYNCFVDRDFSKYLASRAFLFDRCHKDGHTMFTTFLNDDEYISAIEAFQSMIPECNKKASMLQERKDLLSRYFDVVSVTPECALECHLRYDKNSDYPIDAINVTFYPNKDDVIEWSYTLIKLESRCIYNKHYWFTQLRDGPYFMSNKTDGELSCMAQDIEKRSNECYAAVKSMCANTSADK